MAETQTDQQRFEALRDLVRETFRFHTPTTVENRSEACGGTYRVVDLKVRYCEGDQDPACSEACFTRTVICAGCGSVECRYAALKQAVGL